MIFTRIKQRSRGRKKDDKQKGGQRWAGNDIVKSPARFLLKRRDNRLILLAIHFVTAWHDRNCFEKRAEPNGGVRTVFCLKSNHFVTLLGSSTTEPVNL